MFLHIKITCRIKNDSKFYLSGGPYHFHNTVLCLPCQVRNMKNQHQITRLEITAHLILPSKTQCSVKLISAIVILRSSEESLRHCSTKAIGILNFVQDDMFGTFMLTEHLDPFLLHFTRSYNSRSNSTTAVKLAGRSGFNPLAIDR